MSVPIGDLPPGVLLVPPGGGRVHPCGPMRSAFVADGEEAGHRYAVSPRWVDPGRPGPGAHEHDTGEAPFRAIEGSLTFLVGGEHEDAPAGTFLRIPAGVRHEYESRTAGRAGAPNARGARAAPGGRRSRARGRS